MEFIGESLHSNKSSLRFVLKNKRDWIILAGKGSFTMTNGIA
jgi:hypothetical protein